MTSKDAVAKLVISQTGTGKDRGFMAVCPYCVSFKKFHHFAYGFTDEQAKDFVKSDVQCHFEKEHGFSSEPPPTPEKEEA